MRSHEDAVRAESVVPEARRLDPGLSEGTPDPGQYVEARRSAPRPRLGPRRPITECSTAELDHLVAWVQSDGRLRTDEELLDELVTELGFRRRGSRIVATLTEAIDRARPRG